MKVTTLGIDLAKSIFQLHGVDAYGKVALQKSVTRAAVEQLQGPAVVAMTAASRLQ